MRRSNDGFIGNEGSIGRHSGKRKLLSSALAKTSIFNYFGPKPPQKFSLSASVESGLFRSGSIQIFVTDVLPISRWNY